MGHLTINDKTRLLEQVKEATATYGKASLTNVELSTIDASAVDVIAVGSLVLRRDGSAVLVRRAETPSEWVIPGGTVDPGENLLETAIREVWEETGLETRVDGLLRVGLARDYGPEAFRQVNRERFGKDTISLLFVNFRSREIGGRLDCSADPSGNILEVRAFQEVPFAQITHVYKVLFVQQGLHRADLAQYPPVEFEPSNSS